MKDKLNCWEYKKCGKGVGGDKSDAADMCPAATENRYHGINNGKKSGRICWIVAGTLCDCHMPGKFAKKHITCMSCDFYTKVKEEEGYKFQILDPEVEK